jgi:hypothetical protein
MNEDTRVKLTKLADDLFAIITEKHLLEPNEYALLIKLLIDARYNLTRPQEYLDHNWFFSYDLGSLKDASNKWSNGE